MKKNKWSIAFILVSMAMIAITDGLKGILMPVFMDTFNVQNTQMSFMLMLSSFAYIISSFSGGFLCEKFGHRRIFAAGIFLQFFSILGFTQINSYTALLVVIFTLSIANGLIGISLNTLIPLIAVSAQAVFVNISHFCFGLGLTGIQKVGGILIYNSIDFRQIYMGVAVICAIYIVFFLLTKTPSPSVSKTKTKNKVKINSIFFLMVFTLGFYAFSESLMSSWFINYMVKGYGLDFNKASTFAAIFLLTFSLGRLFGGFIVEKIGIEKSIQISLFIALILCIPGLLLKNIGFIFLSFSGLFFAIVYPTCTLWIVKLFPNNSISTTGLVTTCISLLNIFSIFILGRINDLYSIKFGFWILSIALCLSFTSSFILARKSQHLKN